MEQLEPWLRWSTADTWRRAAAKPADDETREVIARALAEAEAEDPGPLEALSANRRAVDLLTGWRWIAVADARRRGATWDEIAQALGITRQSAWRAYRQSVEQQAHYIPSFDRQAHLALLGEEPSDDGVTGPVDATARIGEPM